jgi:YHS domain-containing protein
LRELAYSDPAGVPQNDRPSFAVKRLRGFSTCGVRRMTVESIHTMKMLKNITALALTATFLAAPLVSFADEKKKDTPKPYPLDKCIVSDEKLGEMGKPFVFTYEGQEIKLCCKSCQKDFNKDPKKYLKKLEGAGKTDKK